MPNFNQEPIPVFLFLGFLEAHRHRLAKTKDGEFVLQQYYEYCNSNDGYWSTLDTELLEDK